MKLDHSSHQLMRITAFPWNHKYCPIDVSHAQAPSKLQSALDQIHRESIRASSRGPIITMPHFEKRQSAFSTATVQASSRKTSKSSNSTATSSAQNSSAPGAGESPTTRRKSSISTWLKNVLIGGSSDEPSDRHDERDRREILRMMSMSYDVGGQYADTGEWYER